MGVDANYRVRVGAVSYLNTVPLVWGMLHGVQRDSVDLSFSIPALCAEEIENGLTEVGIVPVAEIARQGLEIVSDVGITCRGAVRSILLCSRKPIREIRTLAADASSRTSVQLARVILRERYGVEPAIARAQPDLKSMLADADAALLIGDPALRLHPAELHLECLDLGAEWWELTKLPMVFAAWAGKPGLASDELWNLTRDSYNFGREHLEEIVTSEFAARGVSQELAREYLTKYIRFEIGRAEQKGLQAFLELAQLSPGIAA